MIASLITTIMMALGVATGNVSSNVYKGGNAFNHELTEQEEKPTSKKLTEYTYNETLDIEDIQHIYGPHINNTPYTEYEYVKYYLKKPNEEPSTVIVMPNMIITNTIYTINRQLENRNLEQWAVLRIKNNYPGTNIFTLKIGFTSNGWNRSYQYAWTSTDENTSNAIDLTMTANVYNEFKQVIDNIEKTRILNRETTPTNIPNTNQYNSELEVPTITLQKDEEIYIIIANSLLTNGNDIPVNSQFLQIQADYIAPERNTEIVDIPNLLYTVLTMPFAFYSTAFNLTVFPNTPYSLNFGNLILTILAALILFYLIKKVVK